MIPPERRAPAAPTLALISALLAAALFLLEARRPLDLSDEGLLWYGSIATLRWQIPLRDFQAFEPARYYWVAAFMRLLRSDGPVALRISLACCMGLGVWLGLSALRRVFSSTLGLAAAGSLLLLWMWPSYRAFESTLTLATVLVATRLLEQPIPRRAFELGLLTGAAWFVGRNLGAYDLAASVVLLLWTCHINRQERSRLLGAWLGGIGVGILPLLLYCLLVPGFLQAELRVNEQYVRAGATNLAKSLAWPWTTSNAETLRVSIAALLLPLLYLLGAWRGARRGLSAALLLGSSVVAATYYHYLVSRPDLSHLSLAIEPALVSARTFSNGSLLRSRPTMSPSTVSISSAATSPHTVMSA